MQPRKFCLYCKKKCKCPYTYYFARHVFFVIFLLPRGLTSIYLYLYKCSLHRAVFSLLQLYILLYKDCEIFPVQKFLLMKNFVCMGLKCGIRRRTIERCGVAAANKIECENNAFALRVCERIYNCAMCNAYIRRLMGEKKIKQGLLNAHK